MKRKVKLDDGSFLIFEPKEAMLMDIDSMTKKELMKELNMNIVPKVIIIDGVDGVGKTTIVQNIINKIREQGQTVKYNTFKRRRNDNENFKEATKKYEWVFRKEVVQQINK